jgi:alkylation response protein AidB-like acyl-CoA dehydrogenase
MDLSLPAEVAHAAGMTRQFVEPYLAVGRPGVAVAELVPLVAQFPLAHFAAFRELGRVPAPWAEIFRAARLPFHDLSVAGLSADDTGLLGLTIGDPRREADDDTLGIEARPTQGGGWELHGVGRAPGYLAPVDSLLAAARLVDAPRDLGLFLVLVTRAAPASSRGDLLGLPLDGAPARLLARGPDAWQRALRLRRRERLSQIALAVGAASHAHEASLAAAREATATRDPLALGQGVQFQIADNAIDLQVAETLALHSFTLAQAGTLDDATLASTRFVVLDAFARIAERAAHVAGLFAATPAAWSECFLDLARRLRLEGGAVELDRRAAARGLLQSA